MCIIGFKAFSHILMLLLLSEKEVTKNVQITTGDVQITTGDVFSLNYLI